jgi:hypothetical protein
MSFERVPFDWEHRKEWLDMPFPMEEYEDRVARVRLEMKAQGLDCLLIYGAPVWLNGDVRWISNFLTVIGNTIHDWLPFATPSLSLTSDAKSHFFNATFVGNIVALPAGTNAFLLDELSEDPITELGVEQSHNYVILMGADYWRLSVSAGPAYLSTKIETPEPVIPRRIDADRLSPAARVRYLGSGLSLHAMYFYTRITGDLADMFEEIAKTSLGRESPEEARDKARKGPEVVRGLADAI